MAKALRLFVLKDTNSGVIVKDNDGNPLYFSDKMVAKRSKTEHQHVSYGPDHKKFVSK